MKEFFKRLFCKHNYIIIDSFISNGGMTKTQVKRCCKCYKYKYVSK